MKEYRYRLSHTLFRIVLIIISIAFILLGLRNESKLFASACIVFSIILTWAIYSQIKFDKMYSITVDKEKLLISVLKGWVSEETKMLWEDITFIRCYRKYLIVKKVNICTRYKSVTLNIKYYNNYKEVLSTIVNNTRNNNNIRIEQTVYDMLE